VLTKRTIRKIYSADLLAITGIVFFAVAIMCEIGDFSAFKRLKQPLAYLGVDSEVKPSGKFNATKVHMLKPVARITHRTLFAAVIVCIRKKRNRKVVNPYLY
jgi:transposase